MNPTDQDLRQAIDAWVAAELIRVDALASVALPGETMGAAMVRVGRFYPAPFPPVHP